MSEGIGRCVVWVEAAPHRTLRTLFSPIAEDRKDERASSRASRSRTEICGDPCTCQAGPRTTRQDPPLPPTFRRKHARSCVADSGADLRGLPGLQRAPISTSNAPSQYPPRTGTLTLGDALEGSWLPSTRIAAALDHHHGPALLLLLSGRAARHCWTHNQNSKTQAR